MTTEQQLFWVTFGAIGLLAFMVFMWGMVRAKYYDECSRKAFLNAENKALDARLTHSEYIIGERESELYDADKDIEQLGVIIKK
jgi:Tfp pilus assembly protein PilN